MKNEHRIIVGDSRKMSLVEDESVQLIITSPPYWQLKDYGVENQIGFDNSYEEYINNLNLTWQECFRVLTPGCRLCINIGDQFARAVYYGRYKVVPIRTEIIKFCETIGLDYMGAIIWRKVTTTNTTGGASVMGSFPLPRNGILKLDYEFILIFKKLGRAPKPTSDIKERAKLTTEEWNTYFSGHWNFPGERQEGHIAKFPIELPYRLIRMFSFPGEWVLDPFTGSGTTNVAAARLDRQSIGYEINEEFAQIAEKRLNAEKSLITHFDYKVEKQDILDEAGVKQLQKKLPYYFRDTVQIDKKTDPRKWSFGSKITGKEKSHRQGYKVSKTVSVNEIELENGQHVRLLGVAPVIRHKQEAVSFLETLFKGQSISLKFDAVKYDDKGRLLAYVYLPNRTFVNGHLLKTGLARLDTSIECSKSRALRRYIQKNMANNAS